MIHMVMNIHIPDIYRCYISIDTPVVKLSSL